MITTDRKGGYSINKFEIGPGMRSAVQPPYDICRRCFFHRLLIHANNLRTRYDRKHTEWKSTCSKPEMAKVSACTNVLPQCCLTPGPLHVADMKFILFIRQVSKTADWFKDITSKASRNCYWACVLLFHAWKIQYGGRAVVVYARELQYYFTLNGWSKLR